jgi:hypothetical protein
MPRRARVVFIPLLFTVVFAMTACRRAVDAAVINPCDHSLMVGFTNLADPATLDPNTLLFDEIPAESGIVVADALIVGSHGWEGGWAVIQTESGFQTARIPADDRNPVPVLLSENVCD